jgi:hypothetical protein
MPVAALAGRIAARRSILEGASASSTLNIESNLANLFDGRNAELGEGPSKQDWGDVSLCAAGGGTDAGVDAEEDDCGTITTGNPGALCTVDVTAFIWGDLVDVRCGVLAASRAGVEEWGAEVVCVGDE